MFEIALFVCIKLHSEFKNLQKLICHKTQTNKLWLPLPSKFFQQMFLVASTAQYPSSNSRIVSYRIIQRCRFVRAVFKSFIHEYTMCLQTIYDNTTNHSGYLQWLGIFQSYWHTRFKLARTKIQTNFWRAQVQ